MKTIRILNNASEIAYYQNIFNDLEDVSFIRSRSDKWLMAGYDRDGDWFAITVPHKVVLFIAKGRTLKGALANSMARYYAHKALERKGY